MVDASRLRKKRNLKNKWVKAEATLEDAKFEQLIFLEDVEMRWSVVERSLTECLRLMSSVV